MLGWILLLVVTIVAYLVFNKDSSGSDKKFDEPEALEIQDFTPITLQKYNGKDDPRVLLGVKGKVYDVTLGKAHYGPSGTYAAFAGRDASRGLAKHSFDESMLTPVDAPLDTLSDLVESEREALDQWAEFFEGKYTYCGRLVNPTNLG